MSRRTKIICTLGPCSTDKKTLTAMARAGMDIARLNFSHGNHKEHKKRFDLIRQINRECRFKVKILQDLEGYRIRVGYLKKPILLKKGEMVLMASKSRCGACDIPLDYEGDVRKIKKGLAIYIDDGRLMFEVIGYKSDKLKLKVIVGGFLKERKGINIPGMQLQADILTEKDKRDIEFGIAQGVDFMAQSFVRNKEDLDHVAKLVRPKLPKCQIIAKIENQEGVQNLESIMDTSDAIMIARGDLGVSVPIYKIAAIQKDLIRQCNRRGEMVITATQMLESMVESSRPTRAEVTDIANAILDGTDAVMLSAETAAGRYPVESVLMMRQIVEFTEKTVLLKGKVDL